MGYREMPTQTEVRRNHGIIPDALKNSPLKASYT